MTFDNIDSRIELWSAPYVSSGCAYGVLHMLLPEGHLECFICCFQKYIWSAPYVASKCTYGAFAAGRDFCSIIVTKIFKLTL